MVANAAARLATARLRASAAHANLMRWLAVRFIFSGDVLSEIGAGTSGICDLRRLADSDLTDAALQPVVEEVAGELS